MQEITKRYLLKDKFAIVATIITCIDIILIVLLARTENSHWWLYSEASWTPIFMWLIVVFNVQKGSHSRIKSIFVLIAPAVYLFTSFWRFYDVFSAGTITISWTSVDAWIALALLAFYFLLFGLNLGMGIFFLMSEKDMEEMKEDLSKIREALHGYETLISVQKLDHNKSKEKDK